MIIYVEQCQASGKTITGERVIDYIKQAYQCFRSSIFGPEEDKTRGWITKRDFWKQCRDVFEIYFDKADQEGVQLDDFARLLSDLSHILFLLPDEYWADSPLEDGAKQKVTRSWVFPDILEFVDEDVVPAVKRQRLIVTDHFEAAVPDDDDADFHNFFEIASDDIWMERKILH